MVSPILDAALFFLARLLRRIQYAARPTRIHASETPRTLRPIWVGDNPPSFRDEEVEDSADCAAEVGLPVGSEDTMEVIVLAILEAVLDVAGVG